MMPKNVVADTLFLDAAIFIYTVSSWNFGWHGSGGAPAPAAGSAAICIWSKARVVNIFPIEADERGACPIKIQAFSFGLFPIWGNGMAWPHGTRVQDKNQGTHCRTHAHSHIAHI